LLLGVILAAMPASATQQEAGASAQGPVSEAPEVMPNGQPLPESALAGERAALLLGRRVDAVRIAAVSDERELLKRIPLQPGDSLDRAKLRDSLRALFRTGRFAELEADATLLPSGGVAVDFHTTPNYFNGRVTVAGLPKGGPGETQVISTGRLELGTQFTEAKLKDSEQRMLRLMRENGYWQARVSEEVIRHEDTHQVDVVFHIVAGDQARIGKVTITGDPTVSTAQAISILKMPPGKHARAGLLQRGETRLRNRYAKQKRLRAQITAGVPAYHPESNTVDYPITVEPGPIVEIGV